MILRVLNSLRQKFSQFYLLSSLLIVSLNAILLSRHRVSQWASGSNFLFPVFSRSFHGSGPYLLLTNVLRSIPLTSTWSISLEGRIWSMLRIIVTLSRSKVGLKQIPTVRWTLGGKKNGTKEKGGRYWLRNTFCQRQHLRK